MSSLSVITATMNAKDDLAKTIESVQSQTYPDIQHIIIDGGSTDGTQSYLESLSQIDWVSEKDEGISDAFNKGVRRAAHDYILFLGAGDCFYDPQVVYRVFKQVQNQPMLIAGKVMRTTTSGTPLWQAPKTWPDAFQVKSLLSKLTLPHQGLFTHRAFFEQFGEFDLQCRFAMDYELILRAYHQFPSIELVDEVIATWQEGGVGQGRIFEIYDEYDRIKRQHKIAPGWQLAMIDQWNRMKVRIKGVLA